MSNIININISMTRELLEQIDDCSAALYTSRSEYVRHAVIEQMRIDTQRPTVRQTMAKQLPAKYVIPSDRGEEFDISEDYL